MKFKDQELLEEAYNTVNESILADAIITLTPLLGLLGGGLGVLIGQYLGEDPRSIKQRIQDWSKNRTLVKIANRLKKDPEVAEFVKNPRMKGWQKMLASKLKEDELQYLKQLNRNHF
jgi:hypothetical protein